MDVLTTLDRLGACGPARSWVDARGYREDPDAAWRDCRDGDWLAWLAARVGLGRGVCGVLADLLGRRPAGDIAPGDAGVVDRVAGWARGERPDSDLADSCGPRPWRVSRAAWSLARAAACAADGNRLTAATAAGNVLSYTVCDGAGRHAYAEAADAIRAAIALDEVLAAAAGRLAADRGPGEGG